MSSSSPVRPLIPAATAPQIKAILGGMRVVAETGGPPSDADLWALAAADQYIFGSDPPLDVGALPQVTPPTLAELLKGTKLAEDAVKFMTVMAFIDGALDKSKIARVFEFAKALGIGARFLDEISEATAGQMQVALADMTRANMESITGQPWAGDVNKWLMPYDGGKAEPKLVARFEALGRLGPDTFGLAYYTHFKQNKYPFPGEAKGLNAAFAISHDSAHVLSGYDTTPRGEILVSTFTAAMHPKNPMAGHILPVIFTRQLNMQLNEAAGEVKNALDPKEFWRAWAAGASFKTDTFAPGWNFWTYVTAPLAALRTSWGIPPEGLDSKQSG